MKQYDLIVVGSGSAMNILERGPLKILGAHIVGPHASILIQEILNLMYTSDQSAQPMQNAIHIHPSLNEVVQKAFGSLMGPEKYRHVLGHYGIAQDSTKLV